jgi:trehalose 6-phosphate synthase
VASVPADLVIVANRLPVDRITGPDGEPMWRASPGGLVTAIEPVLRANRGVWIGWPGAVTGAVTGGSEAGMEPFEHEGLQLDPIALSAEEIEGFYEGFSNATLWPLYHDVVAKPEFHREWWEAYVAVNRRFAEHAADRAAKNAMVWVHDYQLQLVPQMLRELRPDLRIGFFLHIPFPPAELFQQLPWRRQILEGLLGADLVGFQLPGGAQNFVRLVRQRVGHKTHRDLVYLPDGRTVRAAAFPISIDVDNFEELARKPEVIARAKEIREFYEGFSNATLWPLYHDVVAKPEFHREWWDSYVRVNRRFAEKAADIAAEGATVWVHDYQMQLVPAMLRELRADLRIGFFLHIPFPPAELFQQLPWRRQLLEGLLGADVVGFQRPGAAQNFVRLVRQRVGHKTHRDMVYLPEGRTVQAGSFPISIDVAGLEEQARSEPVQQRAKEIREQLGNPRQVLLGVDRLDYTKGIYARLRGYSELIAEGHIDVEDTVFVQVATPSRERVEQYRVLRDDIDRLVGRINGDLGKIGRPAISYLHSSFPREEMAALYRAADVMVVTPLRDGMNLVAKEYVACRYDGDGALVLSEFAGAADELRQAFLINPYDINGMKSSILEALHASPRERGKRMRAMRKTVAEHDVKDWANGFLEVLGQARPLHHKQVRPARRS